MRNQLLHSCPELIDYINEIGFLPLLRMEVAGWSAEEVMDEDCQYTKLPDGGWEWPLWSWKGPILQDTGCAYGKFFDRKAAFISREWWPDFCNYRRSLYPYPEEARVDSPGLRPGAASMPIWPVWRWVVTSSRKISFIHATATGGNMAGAGPCSRHRKPFSDGKLAIPAERRKSHTNGCWTTSGKSCRMNRTKDLWLCSNDPGR